MIKAVLLNIAEVVGSNPTRFIFINLVKYGIKLSLFLMVVEQNHTLASQIFIQCFHLLLPNHLSKIVSQRFWSLFDFLYMLGS